MHTTGKLPTVAEYQKYAGVLQATASDTFRYLNFDRLPDYVEAGKKADLGADFKSNLQKELEKLSQ